MIKKIFLIIAVALVLFSTVQTSQAVLNAVDPGPYNAKYGYFPIWYQDSTRQLELCISQTVGPNGPMCTLLPNPGVFDPALPIVFPLNFPDESFWFIADNSFPRNYLVAMATSGAFAGLGGVVDILGWQFRLAVNDVQILQSLYGPGVMNPLNTAIVYVAVTVVLFSLDWVLALLSLSLLPVLYLGVNRISRRVYARSLAVQEQLGVLSNRVQENLSGIRQVKIYAQEDGEIARFRSLCEEFRSRNLSLARIRGTMVTLIGVSSGCATLLVLFAGGQRVIRGILAFADFVAFQAYLAQLAWPTVALGWIVNVFQRGAGALDRIEEILDTRPSVPAAGTHPASPPSRPAPEIRLRGLTFSYTNWW